MNDDAEFEAFLKGEGELSRRLQAMPQPSPSAELDAAILGRIRTSMAQQSAEAANDPGEMSGIPMLAPGLGRRWRWPAGLAATVLVGLFATQALQAPDENMAIDSAMPAHEEADTASAAPAAPAPQAQAAVQPPVVEPQTAVAPAAPPLKPLARKAAARAMAGAAPETAPSVPAQAPPAAPPAPAPAPPPVLEAPVSGKPSPPAPPAPAPQPAPSMVANAAPQPDTLGYTITARDLAKAAPAPKVLMAPPAEGRLSRELKESEERTAELTFAQSARQGVTVTGSSIKREADPLPMLARLEYYLQAGKDDEAKREWLAFRKQFPDYEVAPALEAKIKALQAKEQ